MKARLACAALAVAIVLTPGLACAQEASSELGSSQVVRTGFLLTLLAVAPALFISMTSFIRIAVVLAMVRHAFGMPETPPNAVLVSLALLLTAFAMAPTFAQINTAALQPLLSGDIDVETAIAQGGAPLRDFMLAQSAPGRHCDDLRDFRRAAAGHGRGGRISSSSRRHSFSTNCVPPSRSASSFCCRFC